MICKNCGAELAEGQRTCPYCGADNFEESKKEHENVLNDYRKKAYWWTTLAERWGRKGSIVVLVIIGALLLLALVLAIVLPIRAKMKTKAQYEYKQELALELDELYEAGDFHAAAEKYDGNHYLGNRFERYSFNHTLDMYHGFATNTFDEDIKNGKQYKNSLYFEQQKYWFDILKNCDTYEENGFAYDEEDMVAYYRSQAKHYLVDELKLSEADVEYLLSEYKKIDDYESERAFEKVVGEYIYEVYVEGKVKR